MSLLPLSPDSTPEEIRNAEDTVPTEYGSPFDDSDADIILSSCDRFNFRVHKLMLSKASTVFANMFSLPTAKSVTDSPVFTATSDASSPDGLTIVEMVEDRHALAMLFYFIYPYRNPSLSNITELTLALRLADKFQIDVIRAFAEDTIAHAGVTFGEPERLFAVGWLYRSRIIVSVAAKATLSHPVTHAFALPKEFDDISASALYTLQDYHRRCGEAASNAIHLPATWDDLKIAPGSNLDKISGPRKRITLNTFTETYISENVVLPGAVGDYVERASALLQVRPDPSTTRDLSLWSSFQPEVYSNKDSLKELQEFIHQFENVIEKALNSVS
ncbi:hypothetical protein EVG20_g9866 [Dentipellis fragilis]|uniref:BTB domain-containing protein n=1 Tax=Dentipellis fragilis TaxID=205917 RepID=A0A4Y9XW90_9AGAM|nr:hypothetical protein EVG20_g9866 [Dentipellis fragilis]